MSNLTETLDDAARILHQRFKAQDDRIEKMEKALSEEMAKVREMDDILSGVVKRVDGLGTAIKNGPWIVDTPDEYATWQKRYFQGTDPVTDGTSKMASAEWSPDAEPKLKFTTAGPCHTICIMPKGNPSGIPFSVALEYLKAGRKVRRAAWDHGCCCYHGGIEDAGVFKMASSSDPEALFGEQWTWTMASIDILANDWMVLPESTK